MDPGVGRELLAPEPHGAEQQDHRVERVPALPGIGRGVGLEAVEDDVDILGRERMGLDVVPVAGVEQEGGVDAVEQPIVDHELLATPPLLGGRAEEHDLAGQIVGDCGEGDGCAHAGGGHRVVAAAVSESGQRVVFGKDRDSRAVAADRARPPRRIARMAVASEPAGCSTSKP